jgi:hypothetical protein
MRPGLSLSRALAALALVPLLLTIRRNFVTPPLLSAPAAPDDAAPPGAADEDAYACKTLEQAMAEAHLPRYQATLQMFGDLAAASEGAAPCGCLRLEDALPGACAVKPRVPPCSSNTRRWLLLLGDSTMRQFFVAIQSAALRAKLASSCFEYGQDANTRQRGSKDLLVPSLDLVVSYRQMLGLSSTKALHLLRHPHLVPRPEPADISATGFWEELFAQEPILDEGHFRARAWRMRQALGHSQSVLLESCGPDFVAASSGLWENPTWNFSLETHRCGFSSRGVAAKLWPRRLRTLFSEACARFGGARFLWRTSPEPISKQRSQQGAVRPSGRYLLTPKLNALAKQAAHDCGVPVLDYHATFASNGYASTDQVHPSDYIAALGLLQVLSRAESHDAGFARARELVQGHVEWLRGQPPPAPAGEQ